MSVQIEKIRLWKLQKKTVGHGQHSISSTVPKNHEIPMHLKPKVFDQSVLSVLTYGTQTWTFTAANLDKIRKTKKAIERSMLGIRNAMNG